MLNGWRHRRPHGRISDGAGLTRIAKSKVIWHADVYLSWPKNGALAPRTFFSSWKKSVSKAKGHRALSPNEK
jgi:hypothetical protein